MSEMGGLLRGTGCVCPQAIGRPLLGIKGVYEPNRLSTQHFGFVLQTRSLRPRRDVLGSGCTTEQVLEGTRIPVPRPRGWGGGWGTREEGCFLGGGGRKQLQAGRRPGVSCVLHWGKQAQRGL